MALEAAYSASFAALGTRWWIELFDETEKNSEHLFKEIKSQVAVFENNYSRFQTNSLVSTLNKNGVLTQPPQQFIDILTCGQKWYRETDGIFNILLGNVLESKGYGNFAGNVEKNNVADPSTDLLITSDKIELKNGLVDIGGYGKGWLIDQIAHYLQQKTSSHWLVNGGGDMRISAPPESPIAIYLEDPCASGSYLAQIEISEGSFAASTPHKRAWKDKHTSAQYTHLTNPGDPSLITSTSSFVVAPSATEADMVATSLSIDSDRSDTFMSLIERNGIGYALMETQKVLFCNQHFPTLIEI